MISKLERLIIFRYFFSKRKEGAISLIALLAFLGICLGVATLIVVTAVMTGFRAEITEKILGVNGHITVNSYQDKVLNYQEIVEKIKTNNNVTSAYPVIDAQVMVTSEYQNAGALVRGMRYLDFLDKKIISDNLVPGSDIKSFGTGEAVILGIHLASNLGVRIGDEITLLAPGGNVTALGTLPRIKTYYVAGLFDSGMFEYDNSFIYMLFSDAQKFFKYKDAAKYIEVNINDPFAATQIRKNMIKQLGDYQIYDWQMLNSSFMNALAVEKSTMRIILTLVIFIASFNIISSMIMLVNDKIKSIAVLKTLGATRFFIMRVFFSIGALIGVTGTFFGVIAGIIFAKYINEIKNFIEGLFGANLFDQKLYFLDRLPAIIVIDDVIIAITVGITCSFLATLYPALKASRYNPVEILRYE